MTDTWVIVADGSRARFFATDAELAELAPVREVTNHHHAGAHRGRTDEGAPHHGEEAAFARELAGAVAQAVLAHEVRDLVLVAPAKFMSELEGALSPAVARHVTGRVAKDFTKLERHELARRTKTALGEQSLLAGRRDAP
jgi:protein required for attachment to host cells